MFGGRRGGKGRALVPALGALLGDMINDLVYLDFAEEFGYRAGDDCRKELGSGESTIPI